MKSYTKTNSKCEVHVVLSQVVLFECLDLYRRREIMFMNVWKMG